MFVLVQCAILNLEKCNFACDDALPIQKYPGIAFSLLTKVLYVNCLLTNQLTFQLTRTQQRHGRQRNMAEGSNGQGEGEDRIISQVVIMVAMEGKCRSLFPQVAHLRVPALLICWVDK